MDRPCRLETRLEGGSGSKCQENLCTIMIVYLCDAASFWKHLAIIANHYVNFGLVTKICSLSKTWRVRFTVQCSTALFEPVSSISALFLLTQNKLLWKMSFIVFITSYSTAILTTKKKDSLLSFKILKQLLLFVYCMYTKYSYICM